MLKTLIVLPDGTELFSGVGAANAIQSATITECVNGAQELTLGSTCANMVEAKIITPEGGLSIATGDEITVYKVDDAGQRHKIGLFTMEKPTRESANRLSITAYDRVSWLDKDLTQWLAKLDAWPYPLYDFATLVCEECGLTLLNEVLPNGSYLIQKFSAAGITGRQIMQWVGEAAGRFCRATADGEIEFAWYTPVDIPIGPVRVPAVAIAYDYAGILTINSQKVSAQDDGSGSVVIGSDLIQAEDDGAGNVVLSVSDASEQIYYYQNGLSFEDYQVAAVQKVQIRQTEEDVGTVYPDVAEAVNTYIIGGNYLLTTSSADALRPVAQTLYEQLKDVVYTPCKVSVPASLDIHAGNTVQITDRNGKTITAYVMTKTQTGQKDTLECTGSAFRDSSTAVNNQTFKALSGKVMNLRMDVEGLRVENKDTAGNLASLGVKVGEIDLKVQSQQSAVDGVQTSISEIRQQADSISATVQSIQDNGVQKVTNTFGLTIEGSAVVIHKSDSEMTNSLTEKGMYVIKNKGKTNETVMLQADAEGVNAENIKVRKYLTIGSHARLEDYEGGTGCFYIG